MHEYLDYGTENTKTRKSLICLQKLCSLSVSEFTILGSQAMNLSIFVV
ncbi:MAG: hypothetical protein E6677_01050 [Finegoldia magna]|nr:hypothetical protein [Finegoldia magna]